MEEEKKLKQVKIPNKKFMAEMIPDFWEFVKDDFKPEEMVKYGNQTGFYVYKRNFQREDALTKLLMFKMEFVECEEEINNKRKE